MEIGSEYNLRLEKLSRTNDNVFNLLSSYHSIFLNSGRSAIQLLDEYFGEGELLVPEFICDCVCSNMHINKIIYYKLNADLNIDLEDLKQKISNKTKAIFVMNYFGHLQPDYVVKELIEIKSKYSVMIIEDTTHSIFSSIMTVGDVAICSLRKWFPISDGGVLYSKDNMEIFNKPQLIKNTNIDKTYAMILKTLYLDNVLECNEIYRSIFMDYENGFDTQREPMLISNFSKELLKYFNIGELILKRKNNYKYLEQYFNKRRMEPICKIDESECPLSFPIRIKNRDRFREYLIDNKIFCAIHWPIKNTVLEKNKGALELSEQIISLPIDQRYGYREMDYLINKIEDYDGEI